MSESKHKVISIESESQYTELLKHKGVVCVDFYAQWCGPCKKIAPEIEALASKHTDVLFLKVDVDEFKDLASAASIEAMPTFKFYSKGVEVASSRGANVKKITDALGVALSSSQ